MVGRMFKRVETRRPDLRFPLPERMAERLQGRTLEHLGRRSKYLIGRVSGGEVLIMHLGMSGRFTVMTSPRPARNEGKGRRIAKARDRVLGEFVHETGAAPRHDHVVFDMSGGTRVTYNDPRRFGFMVMVPETEFETHALIRDLGPEPLGNAMTATYLARRAMGRKADLKSFLMDQRNVAGLGNIYVAEALFRAELSPNRAASCLADQNGRPTARAERLVPAIRQVLEDAIAAGGSTLRDYRAADGELGYFQHQFLVYGRAGEACARPGCQGIVRRSIHGGRSTFHCSKCQR